MLRSALTPELTSAKTVLRFLPELNQITEDFISFLRTTRDTNGVVSGFEEVANRMGMESEFGASVGMWLNLRHSFYNVCVLPKTEAPKTRSVLI
jgi:hypothetical protein